MRKGTRLYRKGFWLALLSVGLSAVSLGCGRSDTVYGTIEPVKVAVGPPISIDGRSVLPRGFYNQSVNSAGVDIWSDNSNSPYLRLRILDSSQNGASSGGFNGSGKGNRALVGISLYDNTALANFAGLEMDSKTSTGNLTLDALLIVDLNCAPNNGNSHASLVVLRAEASRLNSVLDLEGGFKRYSALTSDSVWTSSQGDLVDPGNNATLLLPKSGGTASASLDALINAYPNACLKNTASGDPGLPRNIGTAAVLISLGSDTSTDIATLLIDRIKVNTDVYKIWEAP